MSYFLDAYKLTMKNEGSYGNDSDDVGGETFKGISRVYNPDWTGWGIIDTMKQYKDFPSCLGDDEVLNGLVEKFYKQRYFDPFRGDDMPRELALEMFDTSVNMGIGRAVEFLQIALNVLNRNQQLYPDMVVDGSYGPTTHKCLYDYLQTDSVELLCKVINVLQGNHYIEYMTKSPKQEKYARGWFSRIIINKY